MKLANTFCIIKDDHIVDGQEDGRKMDRVPRRKLGGKLVRNVQGMSGFRW